MKHLDEEILKMREQQEDAENRIEHENTQGIVFANIKLFDDFIELQIPEDFKDLPKDLAKVKYPMEDRPSVIKSNPDTSVNFAFNLLPLDQPNPPVDEVTSFFHSVIKKMQPANRFLGRRRNNRGKLEFGYFDFISPGMDEKVYTMMSFFVLGNQLFQVILNCPARVYEFWKPIAIECLESVSKLEEENES